MPTLSQTPKSKTAAADALVGLWTVALTASLIATLDFARPILIPLALAALLTFLLSPLVTGMERWIGRVAAVLLVVTMIFTVTSVTGWVLTRQLVDLATKDSQLIDLLVARDRIELPTQGFSDPY
jgi:predicted PurR-regulated permease PerM